MTDTDYLTRAIEDRDALIVELQHRHRRLVHDAKGNAAFARNIVTLIERDGFTEERQERLRAQLSRLSARLVEHALALENG